MKNEITPRMYDSDETSKLLGITRNRLRDLYRNGKIFMKKIDGRLYTIDEYLIQQVGCNAEEIKAHSLSAKEAAAYLNYNPVHFRILVQKGKIPHIRIFDRNRFNPDNIKPYAKKKVRTH